jgi:hypothetical protein
LRGGRSTMQTNCLGSRPAPIKRNGVAPPANTAQPPGKRAKARFSAHAKEQSLQGIVHEREWAVMQPQVSVKSALSARGSHCAHQPPGSNLCWTPVVAYVASYYSRRAVSLDDVLRKVVSWRCVAGGMARCVIFNFRFTVTVLPETMPSLQCRCERYATDYYHAALISAGYGGALRYYQRRLQLGCA